MSVVWKSSPSLAPARGRVEVVLTEAAPPTLARESGAQFERVRLRVGVPVRLDEEHII